jgi:hypothetical protein
MTGFRAAPATQRLPFQLTNLPEERALASLSTGDGVSSSHHPFAVKAEGGAPLMVLQLERVSPLRFQSSLLGARAHPAPDVNVVRLLHPFRQGLETVLPEDPDADRGDLAELLSVRVLPT